MFHRTSIQLATTEALQLVDITSQVLEFGQKFQNGLLVAASLHTTAGVRINESCRNLDMDFKVFAKKLADPSFDYEHNKETVDGRPNAHSHLLSYLIGSSETIVIADGKPQLGTWQRVFFVELDGPREEGSSTDVLGGLIFPSLLGGSFASAQDDG